jgi:hypothetical protein
MSDKSNCTNLFLGPEPDEQFMNSQVSIVGHTPGSDYEPYALCRMDRAGRQGLSHHIFDQSQPAIAI